MITLPGYMEFLSDAWLDEARLFLERDAAHRKDFLGGRPFSVSERFTDLLAPGATTSTFIHMQKRHAFTDKRKQTFLKGMA